MSAPASGLATGRGLAAGIGAGAFWGLIFLLPIVAPGWTALDYTVGRYLAWGGLSALLCAAKFPTLRHQLARSDLWPLIGLAVVGNVVYYACVAYAVSHAGVAPASLIVGSLPITITIASALVDDRHTAQVRILALRLPLTLIAVGMICVSVDALSTPSTAPGASADERLQVALGLLAALGAVAAWTYFAVANTRHLQANPRISAIDWNNLTGLVTGLVVLPFVPMLLERLMQGDAATSTRFVLACSVVAVLASTVAAALWNVASRRLPGTLGGQLIVSETVFALVYGFCWTQRWPRPLELVAIVLLVAGVVLSVRRHA
ncbi:DMT family transporter [soil metagenome]